MKIILKLFIFIIIILLAAIYFAPCGSTIGHKTITSYDEKTGITTLSDQPTPFFFYKYKGHVRIDILKLYTYFTSEKGECSILVYGKNINFHFLCKKDSLCK